MKLLYVSDLDGTLLDQTEKLDSYTIQQINQLIAGGTHFTISTGRGNSIRTILKELHLKLPVMLLNGTLHYDFQKQQYINSKPIPKKTVLALMQGLQNFDWKTFEIQTLIEHSVMRFSVFDWNQESPCLALNLIITADKKAALSAILRKVQGIQFFINPKVYADNEWFCDIVLENVSKASSLKEFKEHYRFDKVIAFGDSQNDLPLLEAADEFYAVSNAEDVVKQKATGIIDSNLAHGVVKFMLQQNTA